MDDPQPLDVLADEGLEIDGFTARFKLLQDGPLELGIAPQVLRSEAGIDVEGEDDIRLPFHTFRGVVDEVNRSVEMERVIAESIHRSVPESIVVFL